MDNSMYFDLKFLKSNCIREPYFHGLGCIRLLIEPKLAINFYCEELLKPTARYIHTHQSILRCKPLHGTYINKVYDYETSEDETDWCLKSIRCKSNIHPTVLHKNIIVLEKESCLVENEIVHNTTTFHDIIPQNDVVITLMEYDFSESSGSALLLFNKNDEYVCGLGDRGEPEENWLLIEKILNKINHENIPRYC